MINKQCKFEGKMLNNKAYRPNSHLLYIVMHYNGNIILFSIIIITT